MAGDLRDLKAKLLEAQKAEKTITGIIHRAWVQPNSCPILIADNA